jgi:hypothetical protein
LDEADEFDEARLGDQFIVLLSDCISRVSGIYLRCKKLQQLGDVGGDGPN